MAAAADSSAMPAAADSDDDAPPVASSSRANKNRPAQLSSKRAVSTFRVAPGLRASTEVAVRDPRFDPRGANEFDEVRWRNNYDFVFEKQREEVEDMKATLAKGKKKKKRKQSGQTALSEEESAAMQLEVERMQNRLSQDERKVKQEKVRQAARKEEVKAVKEGKKPFFQKRSTLRERELVAQYEELKKGGKLEKFLAKRRRKVDAQQKRALPARASDFG